MEKQYFKYLLLFWQLKREVIRKYIFDHGPVSKLNHTFLGFILRQEYKNQFTSV